MNPSNEPFDPASKPLTPSSPPTNSSASDAAAMQAIEALEVESNELPETEAVPAPPTPVPDLNKSLAEEVPVPNAASNFQPFAQGKKSSKKPFIILIVIIIILILGAGGYFGWQYLQSQNTPSTPVETTSDTTLVEEVIPTDTGTSITETVNDIEAQLSGMDDTDYSDTTLSDSTLYN